MRSKTSFFNWTMCKKSMARFWPLWAAYFAVWLLALPVVFLSDRGYGRNFYLGQEYVLELAVYAGVIGGAVMAILAAMAVWSFLYSSRSAHGMACLPVRREAQYGSALLAGFLPVLASNVVIFLLTLLAEAARGPVYPEAALTWLAAVTLIYLFFYAFATLCAQLTGSIVILPLVYGVLNFTVWAVRELVTAMLSRFVYGMTYAAGTAEFLNYLSPPMGYLRGNGAVAVSVESRRVLNADGVYRIDGYFLSGWRVVLSYAVVGLILLALALLLFRRRRMETAGDVVAVNALKPVFRWCMALGCGLVFGMLMYGILLGFSDRQKNAAFLVLLIFTLVGAFIGWFASEMLMKKSFRVFRQKSWAGLGICFAVILVLMLGMRLDLFGYEKRVPQADRVEFVVLWANGETAVLYETDNIARVTALHGDVIAHKPLHEGGWSDRIYTESFGVYSCRITYYLQNGNYMTREYTLADMDEGHADLEEVQALLNVPEAVQSRKARGVSIDRYGNRSLINYDFTRDNITYATVRAAMTGSECAAAAGYNDVEEYVLRELGGWDEYSLREMTPAERKEALNDAVLHSALNVDALWEKYGLNNRNWDSATLDIDLTGVYFMYEFYLTPAEAEELYQTCCLSDIADGTLGRVSILDDGTYENEFYNARIEIECREPREDGLNADYAATAPVATAPDDGYTHHRFTTTPTVDSMRTNAWLRAHGVALYTNGETAQHP